MVIYISQVCPPYLTLEFQEETCKKACRMKDMDVGEMGEVIREKDKLIEYLSNPVDNTLVIYSLICLGDSISEILSCIKKILDKNIQLVSLTEPIQLNLLGTNVEENFLLTACIGSSLYTNDFWKKMNNL